MHLRSLSRLFAAVAAALLFSGCKHTPSEKEQQGAQIQHDLGVQHQTAGNVQDAFKAFEQAIALDPQFPEAHNAIGVLYHLSFRRPTQAVEEYEKALELRPGYSEARTNLGNVYLDLGRYDEAIKQYELALNDMLYPTPFIAQGNLGWALHKKGETDKGAEQIRSAVTLNPKFCLGYKNLGLIYSEQGKGDQACREFGRYRETCPDTADAYYLQGVCRAKLGDTSGAKESFAGCATKAKGGPLAEDCRGLAEKLE